MSSNNIVIITVLVSVFFRPSNQEYRTDLVCDELKPIPGVGSSDFNISVIQKQDVSEVMDLLRRTFFVDEPLNRAINLCPNGYGCPELEEFCRKDLHSGYSLKATNKEGVIAAVSLSSVVPLKVGLDGDELYRQAQECKNTKFQKILYILAKREKEAKLSDRYPNISSTMEINMVATKSDFRRKGLMTKLIKETIKLAEAENIKLVSVGTSSYYSSKGAEKMGFTLLYKELYSNIKMNGSPIIEPEAPHTDDRFYVKELF